MSKPTTVTGVLKAMIRLFERPRTWTQGPSAADRNGHSVGASSKRACKWCMLGAAYKFGAESPETALGNAVRQILSAEAASRGFGHFIDFNEAPGRTKRQVVAMLRGALRRSIEKDKLTRNVAIARPEDA